MKNLQNIIGWERNFIFSGGDDFCGEKNFWEWKKIFLDIISSSINTQTPTELNKNKPKNTNKKIENLLTQMETKRHKENNFLVNVYSEWRKTNTWESNLENFKDYLISKKISGSNKAQKIWNFQAPKDFNLYKKETNIIKLDNNRKKIKYELNLNDKRLKEIVDKWENLQETLSESKEKREAGAVWWALDLLKNLDVSKIFESEWWIIAAWLALISVFKYSKTLWFWILWTFWAMFMWNEATSWKFMNYINKHAIWWVEHWTLSGTEKERKEEYQLNNEELKWFWEVAKMKLENFKKISSDEKIRNGLLDFAKWKSGDFPKLPDWIKVPEWIDKKDYATVIVKIIAKQSWLNFENNEWLDNIDNWILEKWQEKINNSDVPKVAHLFNHKIESYFSWNMSYILQIFWKWFDEIEDQLEDNWLLDYLTETWKSLEEIWWNSVLLEYDKSSGKWTFFNKKWEEWEKSLILESVDWTWRMIKLTYEWITSIFDSENNPIKELAAYTKWKNLTDDEISKEWYSRIIYNKLL